MAKHKEPIIEVEPEAIANWDDEGGAAVCGDQSTCKLHEPVDDEASVITDHKASGLSRLISKQSGIQENLTDDNLTSSVGDEITKTGLHELILRLQQVTQQRDDLINQIESMVTQVDESSHKLDDANLDAQRYAKKVRDTERQFEYETERVKKLSAQLGAEHQKKAAIEAELEQIRNSVAATTFKDPWHVLDLAVSQICNEWVKFARAQIPADSSLVLLFDKSVVLLKIAIRALLCGMKLVGSWLVRTIKGMWNKARA